MIIIGERINTSRREIEPAVRERNAALIQDEAVRQEEAGADYIDVNCGTMGEEEPAALAWLVRTVQEVVEKPLCLDSPNPAALEEALRVHRGRALLNSISLEKKRFAAMLPLVKEYRTPVIALTMGDEGLPETVEQRYKWGGELVEKLTAAGIPLSDIYLDPLVRPVSTDPRAGTDFLATVRRFRAAWPEIHIVCGLSNISYGLPERRVLNRAFLVMALAAGLDAAILDPLDRRLMSLLAASRLLLGEDAFGTGYIRLFREGKLQS